LEEVIEKEFFENFHQSEETYSRYGNRRKNSLLEKEEDFIIRRPRNPKSIWGFDFSDLSQYLEESKNHRYPWNWIGIELSKSGKLTNNFQKSHYFRNQKKTESHKYSVGSAIRWIVQYEKPELFASSSLSLQNSYRINVNDIPFEKRVSQVVPLFPEIDYLQNPDRIIKKFYISAFKEKRITNIINNKRLRRRNVSMLRLPTMKRLKDLLQELIETPENNYEIFGFQHKIESFDKSTIQNKNKRKIDSAIHNNSDNDDSTADSSEDESYIYGHWWNLRDKLVNHLDKMLKLNIIRFKTLSNLVLPFKIWIDGTSANSHSIIKVTTSLIIDSTQILPDIHDLDPKQLKEISSRYSRIFTWIIFPLPETQFAYQEIGKIMSKDFENLVNPVTINKSETESFTFRLRPLLLSSDAKAARMAAGVSGGGIYPCQMCYIQQTQIPKYSVASCMQLRNWRTTYQRVIENSQPPLGDVRKPIFIDDSSDYDPEKHATEHLTVLMCVMHVIEGYSYLLWQNLIPYLDDKQKFINTIQITGLIDSQKLLNGARIPCHCWRDLFANDLLQNRY